MDDAHRNQLSMKNVERPEDEFLFFCTTTLGGVPSSMPTFPVSPKLSIIQSRVKRPRVQWLAHPFLWRRQVQHRLPARGARSQGIEA
jgi:hypothetical protein